MKRIIDVVFLVVMIIVTIRADGFEGLVLILAVGLITMFVLDKLYRDSRNGDD